MRYFAIVLLLIIASCSAETATQDDETPAWNKLIERTSFPARDTGTGFVFDGELWLSNGWAHGLTFRDLWRSPDGLSWHLVLDRTPYDPYSHIVEFDGRLFAVEDSVWASADGSEWHRLLESTPFAGRRDEGGLFVADEQLVFVGPHGVWSSEDGVDWQALNKAPPYSPRHGFASMYFQGKFWVLGGHVPEPNDPAEERNPGWTSFNDIWWSNDGRDWYRSTAQCSPRTWLTAIVHDQRAYLIAGLDNVNGHNVDETWVSDDGLNWSLLDTKFSPSRHWPTLWSYEGRLLMTGGNAWPVYNDVWELNLPSGP